MVLPPLLKSELVRRLLDPSLAGYLATVAQHPKADIDELDVSNSP